MDIRHKAKDNKFTVHKPEKLCNKKDPKREIYMNTPGKGKEIRSLE